MSRAMRTKRASGRARRAGDVIAGSSRRAETRSRPPPEKPKPERRGRREKGVFHGSTLCFPARPGRFMPLARIGEVETIARSKPDGGPHDKTQRAAKARRPCCAAGLCAGARADDVETHGLSAFGDLALPRRFQASRLCQPARAEGRPAVVADHRHDGKSEFRDLRYAQHLFPQGRRRGGHERDLRHADERQRRRAGFRLWPAGEIGADQRRQAAIPLPAARRRRNSPTARRSPPPTSPSRWRR